MSRGKAQELADKGTECLQNIFKCTDTIECTMYLQINSECPCDSDIVTDLDVTLTDSRNSLAMLKDFAEDSSVLIPLVDCVDRLLAKAQQCIRNCRPTTCDANCVDSCKRLREITRDCLEKSKFFLTFEDSVREQNKLLKEVLDKPRLVICACSSHLNCMSLSAYADMAQSVVSSLIIPLISVEAHPIPQKTKNYLLQKGSLHLAALKRSVPLAEQAIGSGQSVNALEPNHYNSALHIATILEDLPMAKFLLDSGADPCIPNEEDMTPLLLATITQQKSLVEKCCKNSELRKTNDSGFSPILIAMILEDKEMLEIMVNSNTTLNNYVQSIREEEEDD